MGVKKAPQLWAGGRSSALIFEFGDEGLTGLVRFSKINAGDFAAVKPSTRAEVNAAIGPASLAYLGHGHRAMPRAPHAWIFLQPAYAAVRSCPVIASAASAVGRGLVL